MSNWLPKWNSPKVEPSMEFTANPTSSESEQPRSKSPEGSVSRSFSSTFTPSTWMNWGRANNEQYLQDNEHAVNADDEEEEEDEEEDYNNDDIDDQIRDRKKSTSSWKFWNRDSPPVESDGEGDKGESSMGGNNDNNDKPKDKKRKLSKKEDKVEAKEKDKEEEKISHINRIVSSTTSFPKPDKSDEENPRDDAVLYKPHDNSKEFDKINTHKNENLKENIIVPDWDNCLPMQNSLTAKNNITSTLFGNNSTSNEASATKLDLTNWRQFLSQLSTKLGFSSQTLTSVMNEAEHEEDPENSSASKDNLEKEFNLLYERTYKLFGRSLAKLPPHKRACLPSYNKYYTRAKNDEETYVYDQQTQLEEDAADPNTISITNDPMGNLLINHRPKSNNRTSNPLLKQADIVSQRSGPLKKIKKILVIGVHGFFPTRMIRPLIGAPKGTSLKFANEAEKAVIRYCIENGLIEEHNSNDTSIQKIALEKEGKIFDRVSFFTEILQKWQEELNNADFIFVAAHSQGCVVSIILLAQLIKLGILKDPLSKRIGILGMAGINNGPFYGVDQSFFMKAYSAIEHDSLMELFELTKFTSEQSLVYKESMQIIINSNVKVCFIGSINDQLVPLYSAVASHIFHPNIYRACYIDHSSSTPLFIQKLVSLCCQLQNMGYFDNNVLKELSTALAGPLTGGGHSKIYNDGKVYDLGVKFILDTDDIIIPPTDYAQSYKVDKPLSYNINNQPKDGMVTSGIGAYGSFPITEAEEIIKLPITNQVYIKEFNIGKIGTNPFILPWCLRGLLFNIEKNWPNNKKLLSVNKGSELGKTGYDEINELYETFDAWKPESKVLKDLKFRLNGLRASKL